VKLLRKVEGRLTARKKTEKFIVFVNENFSFLASLCNYSCFCCTAVVVFLFLFF
jgi:hypothetical protein